MPYESERMGVSLKGSIAQVLRATCSFFRASSQPPRPSVQPRRPDSVARLPRPEKYGHFWKTQQKGLDWFTWMYDARAEQHRMFKLWCDSMQRQAPLDHVLEFGCGMTVGYADYFAQKRYLGADISEHTIAWCNAHRRNPAHDHVACDFIEHRFPRRFDLVFSHGTIDNTYDMDEFLRAMVRASQRWVYLTAYRGFFPDLRDHAMNWCEPDGCFYNDLSPSRARTVLQECGCRDVAVLPSYTGRADIPFETVIVARVTDAE